MERVLKAWGVSLAVAAGIGATRNQKRISFEFFFLIEFAR